MLEKVADLSICYDKCLWKDGFVFDGIVVLIGHKDKRRVDLLKHKFICLLEEMADDEQRFLAFLELLKK